MLRLLDRLTLALALALAAIAVAPAAAGAETRTFVNFDELFPTGGALTVGPASVFPSTISVSEGAGTVTAVKVTVVALASSSGDDIDMALSGPNGETVMLMSDACGENPNTLSREYWTFEDGAPSFLSDNGPCAPNQHASFMPSNYLGQSDDFSPDGGPAPPYLNQLSFLAGGPPTGDWKLWLMDDNAAGYNGFSLDTWLLTLEVEPPPPAVVTVQVPAPVAKRTGRRAAALAKCKKKRRAVARRKCRARAKKLPV